MIGVWLFIRLLGALTPFILGIRFRLYFQVSLERIPF